MYTDRQILATKLFGGALAPPLSRQESRELLALSPEETVVDLDPFGPQRGAAAPHLIPTWHLMPYISTQRISRGRWVGLANANPIFAGNTPLEYVICGA